MTRSKDLKTEKMDLPTVKVDRKFDLKEFLKLARKVKAITDKERKEGFLIDEHLGTSRFSY
ncbi:hypothetical protein COT86_00190 [Candidatus Collierbacteria bacterium CG10_big_fil_rev_8_21_14_0_10_43_36]|uniref:Uncharacterized protein n=3 Tax=Candidatus Collieribacteriota TaxID=1752725 RepID=A0A2H0DUM3_9BACT|nr:hypothetical protein [bacterium]PIP85854.1 MAG: hypothetical protein COW83_02050 [Candidatus Collierbacteria bacterium CG22_combo_CG10-13_8_21_14_all_43_12]PIS00130.1 MAG: hypothetical protein COT86_00190 [Candidatus Collierbacteria bacterium CG10_big_fil_rev_8_21_14_0_10_43_36]PIZ24871.1 MAG: hypothetical protein COY48_00570 [Candidatus Collierbacteria bacterium CG_4_10_14_0_8_um_filter_43_86]PJB48978.1 MAG: hypothetical protein CO104_00055 [Candidatus Collierbacteria bacterium CG_4_9_14_3_